MITTDAKITTAQQIKDIIEPIPAEMFIEDRYEKGGKSCFLGHIHKHFDTEGKDPGRRGDGYGYGARQLTEKFLTEVHGTYECDGAHVNNGPVINGYTELVIKDRLMHMINDMIEKGY